MSKATPGSVIKRRREGIPMRLGALANKIGCSDSHLSDVEHNKRRPTEKMARRIAKALDLDASYVCLLFGRVPNAIRLDLVRGNFNAIHQLAERWSVSLAVKIDPRFSE